MQPTPRALERKDRWIASGIFLVALVVFVRTLASDVLLGDSGEFQVIAVTGGLAHATGYPIYIAIAKLFTLIPIASIAWRVDFLSALMGSIAVALTFLIARQIGVRRVFAAIGALFLMINPIFWSQSVIAEVYAISAAFFAAFILCLLHWGQARSAKMLLLGGILFGACWGLHHTAVLALPAILVYLIAKKARGKEWAMSIGGGLIGLALAMLGYFYMATNNSKTTAINSIRPSATTYNLTPESFTSTWTRVDFIMNARQFAPQLSGAGQQTFDKSLGKYVDETVPDFGWPAIALSVLGAFTLVFSKARWREGLLLGISWLSLFAFVVMYTAFDIEVDFILSHLLVAVFLAFGLQWLQNASIGKRETPTLKWVAAVAGVILVGIGMMGTISGAASSFALGKPDFLKGAARNLPYPVDTPTAPHDLANSIVDALPDNALVVTEWENEWPIYYVAQFEKNKPGIEAIETFPMGANGKPAQSMIEYLLAESKTRPIFATLPHQTLEPYFDFELVLPRKLFRLDPRRH